MKTRVKICGLNTEATMVAALDKGADFVGLVFFPKSPRHVSIEDAAKLRKLAANKASVVVVTVNSDDDEIREITNIVKPDYLQLHGQETSARVKEIKSIFKGKIIKALSINSKDDLAGISNFGDEVDIFLFDAKPPKNAILPGGNGVAFDWELLNSFDPSINYMLSGGLDPENIVEALSKTHAHAVDVSSGVERAPGIKDIKKIANFFNALHSIEKTN